VAFGEATIFIAQLAGNENKKTGMIIGIIK